MFLLHNSIDNYKFTQYTTKKYLASSLTNTGKVIGGKRVKIREVSPEGIKVTMEERIFERDEF